ncbi:hypothetical protein ACQP00_11260 [Dactylosporangium sp. CS-047395]|uniref:hypothetical protein n=1 Tax=Dactylosporangium sp. CS-047395 TaxID=3239936 RepID=UPI003D8C651C
MTSPQYDPYQPYGQPGVPGAQFPPGGVQQPPAGYQPPAAPAPFRPRTGVLVAIVGGLLALCVIGGSVAAYIVQTGLPDVLPTDLSHRQPKDPCALLGKDAFGTDLGGALEKAEKGTTGVCDFTFAHDSRSSAPTGSRLRLYVEVSTAAPTKFEGAPTAGLSRLPVECGQRAYAGHKVDPSGENADAGLWCLDQDTYLTLTFHGYNHDRFNALELDEIMARIGRTALANVPKAK